jgi:hypothetical protein
MAASCRLSRCALQLVCALIAGLLVLFTLPLSAQSNFAFNASRAYYTTSDPPFSVAVSDFSRDGLPDIVTASYDVSIFLQNPDGSFQTAKKYGLGTAPLPLLASSLQVGDFNGDGKPDTAVAQTIYSGSTLFVLLGNGDGTFVTTALTLALSSGALALGDFNSDGYTDAAVTQSGSGGQYGVAVLLSNGDGSFQRAVFYTVNGTPVSLATADVNNDGKLDVIAGGTGISVLPGNGNGTFQAAINSAVNLLLGAAVANSPCTGEVVCAVPLLVADFDGDGKLDLASATTASTTTAGVTTFIISLTLFLGDGAGSFTAQVLTYPSVPEATGDLNGDGRPDLTTGSVTPARTAQDSVSTTIYPGSYTGGQVLLNNGDRTFTTGQSIALPVSSGLTATLADLNGDQKLDLLISGAGSLCTTCSGTPALLYVLNGNGNGTLGVQLPSYPLTSNGNISGFTAAEFTDDSKIDLGAGILVKSGSNVNLQFGVLVNNGTSFLPAAVSPTQTNASASGTSVIAGDFNGDARMDLAIQTGPGIYMELGNGDGTFQPATLWGVGLLGPVAAGDFNNDGKLDIIGISDSRLSVAVLLGNGDGSFGSPLLSPPVVPTDPFGISILAVADYNGDGNLDVAALVNDSFEANVGITVFFGHGDGTFAVGPFYEVGGGRFIGATGMAVGDINRDGFPDVVFGVLDAFMPGCGDCGSLLVLVGNSGGTFQYGGGTSLGGNVPLDVGTQPAVIADFDLDGNADFVSLGDRNNISFSKGNGDATFHAPEHFFINFPASALAVADFDGNGSPDVAMAGGKTISVLYNTLSGPAAIASPSMVAFPTEDLGQKSPVQTMTLNNTGSKALNITGLEIAGAQSGDYSQTNTCGSGLSTGAACTISATFTAQGYGVRTAVVRITDNAFDSPQTIRLTGKGPSFIGLSLGGNSSTATVAAGQTANYILSVGGMGLSGNVTFTCTGVPQGASCSVPTHVAIDGATASRLNISITTTSRTLASFDSGKKIRGGMWIALILGMMFVTAGCGKRNQRCLYVSIAFAELLLMSSCGGSSGESKSNPNGTPAGTYNVSVTATLNSATETLKLTLVVQ